MNDPINMKDPSGFRPIYTQGEETDAIREASYEAMGKMSSNKGKPNSHEVKYKDGKVE
jgi:hypothetical protein